MSSSQDPPIRLVGGILEINPQNKAFWNNPGLLATYQSNAGFWSSGDPNHLVFHETGHEAFIDSLNQIVLATPSGQHDSHIFDKEWARDLHDNSLALRNMNTMITKELAEKVLTQVGRHALVSLTEFIAEVFAGRMAGKEYDNEIMSFYIKSGGLPI